jgi:dTDP-glucose 4,6-dehydratase
MTMMAILICGAYGFIGFNFSKHLITNGENVILLDALKSKSAEINFKDTHKDVHKVKLDIDKINVKFLKSNKVSKIINFAAESHVDNSITNPRSFVESNILGFENLLRVSINAGVEEVIHFSTDEVYGSIKDGEIDEEGKLLPSSPYSSSKASADLIGMSYVKTYDLNLKIIRPANNYGILQQPEKLIPFSIISLLNKRKIELYGDGSNIRHWLNVDDTIEALEVVRKKGKNGEIYNIGSGEYLSNKILVEKIISKMNLDSKTSISYVENRPGHDFRYATNFKKIKNLGWKPKKNIDTELPKIINWYVENQHWWEKDYQNTLNSRKNRLKIIS